MMRRRYAYGAHRFPGKRESCAGSVRERERNASRGGGHGIDSWGRETGCTNNGGPTLAHLHPIPPFRSFCPCTLCIVTDLPKKHSTPCLLRVYTSLRTAPPTDSWTFPELASAPTPLLQLALVPIDDPHLSCISALDLQHPSASASLLQRALTTSTGSGDADTAPQGRVSRSPSAAGGAQVEDEEDGYEQDEERLREGWREVSRGRGWAAHRAHVQIESFLGCRNAGSDSFVTISSGVAYRACAHAACCFFKFGHPDAVTQF
ncbi:hypothetical protein C8R45DRAFT_927630 [Mycena sanguinolenta]|nr:hypothetical protein C8R45DRAFT_927630 [Mycena sanguinolenta]